MYEKIKIIKRGCFIQMKFVVENIVYVFFVLYIFSLMLSPAPTKKKHDDYVLVEEVESKEQKKMLIKQEIRRLEEEYEDIEFDMSPKKLREWIRAEIRAAKADL